MDNDHVRLLCFDEPSSALDPKAEFGESTVSTRVEDHSHSMPPRDVFEQLRSMKGKKTLIFITQ